MRDPEPHLGLAAFYQRKRDLFADGLRATRLRPLPSAGTYFQCADYSRISDEPERTFCERLTRETGVAAIPMSAFYADALEQRLIRFCFAKQTTTLELALERLRRL
jgi:methionine aminotransferase